MVAVAYSRWSVAIGSNFKALTGKILVFWDWRSLIGGGRLREVVAHGGSTVFGDIMYLRLANYKPCHKNITIHHEVFVHHPNQVLLTLL